MKKQKLVVVGNGMAGIRCVEELLKLAPDLYEITVFGAEPHPNYNRILLSPVLAGEMTIQDIIYRRKPPALPGRLPEFDVSWILQHPIPGVGILTVTDCGQAPLRGQQS